MAEEKEVWGKVLEALCELAEHGKRQTALLEEMVDQGKQRGLATTRAIFVSQVVGAVAVLALGVSVSIVYGRLQARGIPFEIWKVLLLVILVLLVAFPLLDLVRESLGRWRGQ